MPTTPSTPTPSRQPVPQGTMQPFCPRCGSSRCRDAAAHAAGR